jgi:hypothetical protein
MKAMTMQRLMAVVALLGIGAHRFVTMHRPVSVEKYHQHIREVSATIPMRFDGWIGQDVPVPVQALAVLRPNVMLSRRFINVETGSRAGAVLVHCSDSHDMAGHFPMRCYPAKGWDVVAAQARDWDVGDFRVTGTEYEFVKGAGDKVEGIIVANCLLRPGGKVLRDMQGLANDVVGAGGQSSGAGQLQVYFNVSVPREQREAAVREIVSAYRPLIAAILASPTSADAAQ